MKALTPEQKRQKRAEAQALDATLHVGKDGVTDSLVSELTAQLRRRKLVKVRLLPAATAGGSGDAGVAESLAAATGSVLLERRGHTAVYWRA